MNRCRLFIFIAALAALAQLAAGDEPAPLSPSLAKDSRFFEMRTYHAAPGKLEALHARFRDHTNKLFVKHGMEMVAYWVPMDKEGHYENTLVYILAFPNRQAHDDAWKAFQNDPEWKAARAESEKNGALVGKIESVFMTATDYSPIK
jgi:hypothetical protein